MLLKVTSRLSNSHLNYFQVHADFEVYGGTLGLVSCCLYGGAPYQSQEVKLKRGVDIVIGTPGRVKVTFMIISFSVYLWNVKCRNLYLCIYIPNRSLRIYL